MKIVSNSGKGNFKVLSSNNEIGEVVYKNWFSSSATMHYDGHQIELKPKSIWMNTVIISKNGKAIGDITFNLKGHMIIKLNNEQGGDTCYILKNKSTLKLKFELFDENEILQLTLYSDNNWKKLNYDYNIEFNAFNSKIDERELMCYCGYAANLYLSIISAV